MKRRTLAIIILALDSSMIGCKAGDDTSAVKTDLGDAGNQRVADAYATYLAKPSSDTVGLAKTQHCETTGTGTRVILSGFGLFSGANFNPSGTVVSSFADPAFQSDTINLGTQRAAPFAPAASPSISGDGQGPVAAGVTGVDASGGIARNREITIDGQTYEICFLTLDVLWDLAGAIVVNEAHHFKPQLIIMSGRNSADQAIWEIGAINDAQLLAGYNSDGSSATDNRPLASKEIVLSSVGNRSAKLSMNWDNQALSTATGDLIKGISPNYTVFAPTTWRNGNNYVCNNISLITLAAQAGLDLPLAGGKLDITAGDADIGGTATKVGFFHYPVHATNSPAEVRTWIQVLATAVKTTLNPDATTAGTSSLTDTSTGATAN